MIPRLSEWLHSSLRTCASTTAPQRDEGLTELVISAEVVQPADMDMGAQGDPSRQESRSLTTIIMPLGSLAIGSIMLTFEIFLKYFMEVILP
jgi:hypothetical protein